MKRERQETVTVRGISIRDSDDKYYKSVEQEGLDEMVDVNEIDDIVEIAGIENTKKEVAKKEVVKENGKEVFKAEKGKLKALARYFPNFLSKKEADSLFNVIIAESDKYTQDKVNTPGGVKMAPRITGTYGPEGVVYKYAGMSRTPITEWPKELMECMERISETIGCVLNYAFINVYRDGDHLKKDYIGWHKDSEGAILCNADGETTIASISLGDERLFQMRVEYKNGESPTKITSVKLAHGSLCTMEKQMQQFCKHQVPKCNSAKGMRVNITFRNMKLK